MCFVVHSTNLKLISMDFGRALPRGTQPSSFF